MGESFAELESELGLPPGSLDATMSLYNRHAAKGEDPVYQKVDEYLTPLGTPPFGAFDCTTDEALYAVFTLGGLVTDPAAACSTRRGSPSPPVRGGAGPPPPLGGKLFERPVAGRRHLLGRAAGRTAAGG